MHFYCLFFLYLPSNFFNYLESSWSPQTRCIFHISPKSVQGNYSFLNLEIAENSNSYRNFNFLPNELNFCSGEYSREETIQEPKTICNFKDRDDKKNPHNLLTISVKNGRCGDVALDIRSTYLYFPIANMGPNFI